MELRCRAKGNGQLAIREEVNSASTIEEISNGHPMFINIAVHYVRPKQITYTREAFQAIIHEVINSDDLDLEADPSAVCTQNNFNSCTISSFVSDTQI